MALGGGFDIWQRLKQQEIELSTKERDRQNRERNRQAQRDKLADQSDIAIFTYLSDPTEQGQQQLEAICQEIQQAAFEEAPSASYSARPDDFCMRTIGYG